MTDDLSELVKNYRGAIAEALEGKLVRIVLFGSYAQGDYNHDSDMDMMILADVQQKEISYYADIVYDITYDFEEKYCMEINPCVQSIHTYNQWKEIDPFFMNIEKDGVSL